MPGQEITSTSFAEDIILPGPGDVIAGKYRVQGVVGRGGMGVVLAAQHVQLGHEVALKMLLVHGLDDARRREAAARFVKEGQAAARLTSDHVVKIFDVGTLEDGTPFMVMELLRGDDLGALIRRHGAASTGIALEYVAQACDAIGEAHALGIVHRDLKPSNLFVARRSDGRPLVKVLDFGISKALRPEQESFEGDLTTTRAVVGSPLYMSPEQLRDAKRVDPRTDVWSLGMVLYELLTGAPAFKSDTLLGLTAAIAADAPVPPRVHRPDLSEELDAIVLRCLEKDPAKRFQSVSELVTAITPFLPSGPVQTGAEYTSQRLRSLLSAAPRVDRDRQTLHDADRDALDAGSTAASSSGMRTQDELPRSPARRSPGDGAESRGEGKGRAAIDGSTTLVSSTGSTLHPGGNEPDIPPLPPPPAAEPGRPAVSRLLLLALAVVVVVAGAAFSLLSGGTDPEAPAASPAEAPAASSRPRAGAPGATPATPEERTRLPAAAAPAVPSAAATASTAPRKPVAPPARKPAAPRPSAAEPVDIKLER